MVDEHIKQVKINGAAADDYHKSKGTRKRRAPTAKQSGGDAPPGQLITTNQNIKNARPIINAIGKTFQNGGAENATAPQTSVAAKTDIQLITAPGTIPQMPNPVSPAVKSSLEAGTAIIPVTPAAVTQAGGSKKVVLGQKKTKKAKVLLAPPSGKRKASSVAKTRKIRVALSGLKKRITKQRTIAKDSREKPIAEVRQLLEEARLIKPVAEGKKGPPDSVLRDIYKDYLLLRNRAL